MHSDQTVSVIIPAYNEEETIADVVRDFVGHPAVDEVLVVDNNCRDATAELARAAGAKVVEESAPGYGCALRRGMDEAQGYWLVLVEADGSFRALDLNKFLAYSSPDTLVIGTRTTCQLVQQGANMRFIVRWANVFVGKLMEALWYISSEPRLTDVGCTYRLLTKDLYLRLRPGMREAGPAFAPEMMAEVLRHRIRMIEIPVHYFARAGGDSAHSGSFRALARTALSMLRTILRKRFERAPS